MRFNHAHLLLLMLAMLPVAADAATPSRGLFGVIQHIGPKEDIIVVGDQRYRMASGVTVTRRGVQTTYWRRTLQPGQFVAITTKEKARMPDPVITAITVRDGQGSKLRKRKTRGRRGRARAR